MTKAELIAELANTPDDAEILIQDVDGPDPIHGLATIARCDEIEYDGPGTKPFAIIVWQF